jgi:CDP-glucose 4,6-dehydratase
MIDRDFWRGRRVLVTGHNGFKGSWLCLWLQRLGADVTGYALDPPSAPSAFELARVGEGMESIRGDVRDVDSILGGLSSRRPEVLFHMAAQSIVRTSYASPLETYDVNVMGTAAVLEAVRRDGGPRVLVNVTSDKCYESREPARAHREDDPLGGRDPYSSSKAAAELVIRAYRESFFSDADGPRVASARAGNVIGGGDWAADRLVPDMVRAALEGETAIVRNPASVRPWQHVLNPLSGYLRLAERMWDDPGAAGAWNFGPPEADARQVGFVADRLSELWGDDLRWEPGGEPGAHEAACLELDSSRARTLLGWAPAWSLDQALHSVVEWSRAHQAGNDMREVTLGQIGRFEQDAAGVQPEPAR